ncbi:interferon-induced very large GTPase 1-like [Gambusia affinis]|uniref:interferon-induced very large GTPase 1-like n=1 Tax=Gambusia affinis TaxID=33528 RepID=UPI001CDCA0B6|nr:interferon-induced very large GTPase 1-like [Gambusia affinis]
MTLDLFEIITKEEESSIYGTAPRHSSDIKARQETADSIISSCNDSIDDKIKRKTNYHDTYIQEILHIIDEKLSNAKIDADIEFEVSLKQHICGSAAREFQKMHEEFIQENDPYRRLQKNKNKFCASFKDVFYKRDQCQKKAEEFTNQCLKPAVEDFIYRSLGLNIIDEMLTGEEFSTRMSFQYSVLMDLISRNEFELYLYYICSYEDYLKSQISDRIKKHFSDGSILGEIEDRHLESSISNINGAIKKAVATDSLKTFDEEICKELGDKLVISQDALGAFLVLNNADQKQFAHWLTVSVKDMAEALRTDIQNRPFETKLSHLHVKPHVELFNRVIGCGQQCPFCAVPCDAGGKLHTEHFASLHRPQGLGEHRWEGTEQLMTDICSSLIVSGKTFCCSATKDEWHLYKNYKEIYPNWDIRPDISLEASDYWKYVMAKYNQEFAKTYMAKPADIPPAWNNITEQQAKESLKESFNIK